MHNRSAHIGISLRPVFRSRGLGLDAVRVLCRYGFVNRGLHRLQIETSPTTMRYSGPPSGPASSEEGTLRRAGCVDGEFADEAVFGLLPAEWQR